MEWMNEWKLEEEHENMRWSNFVIEERERERERESFWSKYTSPIIFQVEKYLKELLNFMNPKN
jgi:hypothetical protein